MINFTETRISDIIRLSRKDEWLIFQVTEILSCEHTIDRPRVISGMVMLCDRFFPGTIGCKVTIYTEVHFQDWNLEVLEKGPGP